MESRFIESPVILKDGQVHSNLEHASEFTLQAVQRDAQLVLFPEFMSQGYCLTEALWDSAELSQADIDRLNDLPCMVGHLYNSLFGVPAGEIKLLL